MARALLAKRAAELNLKGEEEEDGEETNESSLPEPTHMDHRLLVRCDAALSARVLQGACMHGLEVACACNQRSCTDASCCPPALHHHHQREASGESELSKVVALVLHDRRIAQIQYLDACPNLRTIDLSFNHLTKIEG